MGECFLYVGTYTHLGAEGIYLYRFDQDMCTLDFLELAAREEEPAFLVSDNAGQRLYAVNELDEINGSPALHLLSFN